MARPAFNTMQISQSALRFDVQVLDAGLEVKATHPISFRSHSHFPSSPLVSSTSNFEVTRCHPPSPTSPAQGCACSCCSSSRPYFGSPSSALSLDGHCSLQCTGPSSSSRSSRSSSSRAGLACPRKSRLDEEDKQQYCPANGGMLYESDDEDFVVICGDKKGKKDK